MDDRWGDRAADCHHRAAHRQHPARASSLHCAALEKEEEDVGLQEAICASLQEAAEQRQRQKEAAQRARQPISVHPDVAETFAPFQWLSDASISFAYGRLAASNADAIAAEPGWSRSLSSSADGVHRKTSSEEVLLMDPATAFWLAAQDDPKHVDEARDALRLQDRELVLCPINDSIDRGRADAGTHWTLLVGWDRKEAKPNGGENASCFSGRFRYYNSLASNMQRGNSFSQARALASRLAGKNVQVSVGACAQQTNGFDCGVYVLLFSQIIARTFLQARSQATSSGHNSVQNHLGAPKWEDQLTLVTPKEVTGHRGLHHQVLLDSVRTVAVGA